MTPGLQTIAIQDLKFTKSVPTRAKIDESTVRDYCSRMRAGDEFPPIVVFFDGEHLYLADGQHRFRAAIDAGVASLSVDVRAGSFTEAIAHGAMRNARQGLRLNTADVETVIWAILGINPTLKPEDLAALAACAPDIVRQLKSRCWGMY